MAGSRDGLYIERAGRAAGSPNADERYVRVCDRLVARRRRPETSLAHDLREQLRQSRLDHGRPRTVHHRNLFRVDVGPYHLVARLRQRRSRHTSHVSKPEDTKTHW